jgi:glycine/serine hydroxymethyltransferase
MNDVKEILTILEKHENKFNESFNFVPSENILSSLAKIPLRLDVYSRYFFNDMSTWGNWAFHGGKFIGEIEEKYLIPNLQSVTNAKYINFKAISGLNCMTLVISSYCDISDTIFILPPSLGGHASTEFITKRLGLKTAFIPQKEKFAIDLIKFEEAIKKERPKLIYIDQANVLFPLNVAEISKIAKSTSHEIMIHHDTSHLNGLIFGKAIPNPLDLGADSFGGSTHKSFPGPHKAFFATNNELISKKVWENSKNIISHSHMAEAISFCLALIELKHFDIEKFAKQTIDNAKLFASELYNYGVFVEGSENGFTGCHQIWVDPSDYIDTYKASEILYDTGIIVNAFGGLPTINKPSLRMGFNEVTYLGVKEGEIKQLALYFYNTITKKESFKSISIKVKEIRKKYHYPSYSFSTDDLIQLLNGIERVKI